MDFFSLLGQPRHPWLEPETLKDRFLQLSSEAHPDRAHSASHAEKEAANRRYAEFNLAHNTLKEPRDRLLHLIELERGEKPRDIQRIPPGTMDLFVEVGQLCRDIDGFLAERGKVSSPILKVQMFEKGLDWTDKLQSLQQRIAVKRTELEGELRSMNSVWDSAPAAGPERAGALPIERLEQIYRTFSYIARWSEQINERMVQLMDTSN
jgi:hypothetical protein